MKKLITFLLLFVMVAMVSMQACSKDDNNNYHEIIQPNLTPVSDAGGDTVISIAVCGQTATAVLDGHLSYDPDNNSSLRFLWKQVSGPTRVFDNVDSARNIVSINTLVSGEYMFELEVFDTKGVSDKDALKVTIINKTEYNDLELNLTTGFDFYDNADYYGIFYDSFIMFDSVNITNESYNYNFYQNSDSAVISSQFSNYFNFNSAAGWPKGISGDCSVDFETLYSKGGGNFDGTIKVTGGTAFLGCEDALKDFPPIQITGNLNAATKTITMKLKGRIVL